MTQKREKWDLEKFVQRSKEVHGNLFSYEASVFKTINTPTEVRCYEHGETPVSFYPTPHDHIKNKTRCPKCKSIALTLRIRELRGITQESFLARAREIHGEDYDYSKSVVNRAVDPVEVICHKHDEPFSFFPTPQNHLNSKTGCPICGDEKARLKMVLPLSEFISRCTERHRGKYDYSKVEYKRLHDVVQIGCSNPAHGFFPQLAYEHLAGHGCDKCAYIITKPHMEVFEFLAENWIKGINNHVINNREYDIYCPDLDICIEYNGLYWHTNRFQKDPQVHLTKSLIAKKEGIHVIHIWGDDWEFENEKTKTWLLAQLGVNPIKSNARSLLVKRLDYKTASKFVKEHHMQGNPSPCEYCYGLVSKEGVIHAVMLLSSKTRGEGEICLERFCTLGSVRGGFSKLLKAFIRDTPGKFESIISFSDRSWSTGKVYELNGFTLATNSPPRYWWVKGTRKYDRRGFQKQYLEAKLEKYDPLKSEAENCYENGYFKMYDCGISKWVLTL